jgi:hypothetical protein
MRCISAHSMAAPPAENNAAWERMRLLADEFETERAAQHAAILAMFAQIKRLPPGIHRGMKVTPMSSDRDGPKDGPDWGM